MKTALKNKIVLKNHKLEVEARLENNAQYAFYLHCHKEVEKKLYSDNNKYIFDKSIEDGVYTAVFYRRFPDKKILTENELFLVVNNSISVPQILAETQDYKITYYDNGSDITFITFNGFGSTLKSYPFGLKFLLSKGYNVVACAQNANQYQGLSFIDFQRILSPYIFNKRVFLYGSSLGGYCAIYYAGAVNGTVIAAAPRNSMHPKIVKSFLGDAKSKDFKHTDIIKNATSKNPIYIIVDPCVERDISFIDQFVKPAYPDSNYIEIPYAGHEVLYHLNRIKKLSVLIEEVVEKRDFDINQFIRLEESEFTYYGKVMELWIQMQEYVEKITNTELMHPIINKRLQDFKNELKQKY